MADRWKIGAFVAITAWTEGIVLLLAASWKYGQAYRKRQWVQEPIGRRIEHPLLALQRVPKFLDPGQQGTLRHRTKSHSQKHWLTLSKPPPVLDPMQRRLLSHSAIAANYYKVTLKRSTIGLPKEYQAAAKTLGLHRLQQSTYHAVQPSTAGLILQLKELVQVDIVPSIPTSEELNAHKPDRGYKVIDNTL